MRHRWRGLTWDHPRGYAALRAASAQSGIIDWHTHSLEGFESAPIAELCEQYDLIVLDHPHLGEALAQDCLQPLDDLFPDETLCAIERNSIGLTHTSYHMAGRQWALPLDAATQVMAVRPDLLAQAGYGPPTQWRDVLTLSRETGRVALSLAGPHAFLTLLSICAALDPVQQLDDGQRWYQPQVVQQACEWLVELAARSPASVRDANPIALLQHMTANDDVLLCPLVYGYVNYTSVRSGTALAFHNAPCVGSHPPGSILGGTGIAVSQRCQIDDALIEHLTWLLSENAQTHFIPSHAGQPSHVNAWRDRTVNAASGNFYLDTYDTLCAAVLRPRHDGFIALQTRASDFLRTALQRKRSPNYLAHALNMMCASHHTTAKGHFVTSPVNLLIQNHVAWITLNRPEKLNAMTPEMAELLVQAVQTCNDSDEVRVVVLTGAGPKAFCAGSDIVELDSYATPWDFRNRRDYCDLIRALKKPAIAALNGYAFGGGLEMALACDIRIASDNAKLGSPEIKLGWIGGGGMTAQLLHSIGASNAALMVLTGDPVTAQQAMAWGLLSEVVAPESLYDRAAAIASAIAARAPIAAETAKVNLRAALSMPMEQATAYERDLQTICFATEDAMEGRKAFQEKRPAIFHRR